MRIDLDSRNEKIPKIGDIASFISARAENYDLALQLFPR
jgi:hypothetical protein